MPKTLVYRLATWRNRQQEVIPERIITRPPSAELRPGPERPGQPAAVRHPGRHHGTLYGTDKSAADIVAAGFPEDAVDQVVRLIRINEYKRRQAPPGARITPQGVRQGLALSCHERLPGNDLTGRGRARCSAAADTLPFRHK